MKVQLFGAVGTVTGSRFLVHCGKTRLLVDCGLFQGVKVIRQRNWRHPGFSPRDVDAVVLTHAHLDHSGYLPALVRDGFKGRIYATRATRALCRILLPDAGHIQEEEARYANRKGFSRHSPARPLYTVDDAKRVDGHFETVRLDEAFEVGDVEVTLRDAGHILGASSAVLRGDGRSVIFSGDLGRPDDLMIGPPEPPPAVDTVIMESTYGDRRHPDVDPITALADAARPCLERGGVLLIPSFAVGRAQAILYALDTAFDRGLLPRTPVVLNSPMATNVSDLYVEMPKAHRLSADEVQSLFHDVEFARSVEESKAVNRRSGPLVIVSASGMLAGGRILHHVRQFAPDPNNAIVLPGYQAPGTRGAALLRGVDELKIHGAYVPIRCKVHQIDVFSAHADQGELLDWIGAIPKPPEQVLLVHGDQVASDELRRRVEERLGFDARVPEDREVIEL